eukprot:TRINITY_DN16859_c0_g1_i2.p2 TRINITY_DN16859_c0_g1~~TRINITY_DN16859_c0_g1_i2.p2  ORF type:complete len:127 (+),score=35.49 TRINITY_DN16859_c0_g1_i2:271-651(+)
MAGFGCAFSAPLAHVCWGWLEVVLPLRTIKHTAGKVLLDQIFLAPVWAVLYHCYLGCWALEAPQQLVRRIADRAPDTCVAVWRVWPAVHFVNFYFVSLHYRLLVTQLVNLVWLAAISTAGNRAVAA